MNWSSLSSNRDQKTELSIEIGDYRATLGQMSKPTLSADVCLSTSGTVELMDQVRVIAIIGTSYEPLNGVACVGEAEAWVFGEDRTISRIDIHGSVKNTVTVPGKQKPAAISVTSFGELVYIAYDSKTVNIVRNRKSKTLITAPQGWTPYGLCCARSGDILVNMFKRNCFRTRSKIIRYQGQKITQEIENDILGNPIFNSVYESLFMSENNNGDICVSDQWVGSVIGVDKSGRVRFRYTGTPARRKYAIAPTGIVTDALSQIIFADIINHCLHILNENGQFLRCVDDCALLRPVGLSLDSEGRLWVGLHGDDHWGERYSYGQIVLIEYLKKK